MQHCLLSLTLWIFDGSLFLRVDISINCKLSERKGCCDRWTKGTFGRLVTFWSLITLFDFTHRRVIHGQAICRFQWRHVSWWKIIYSPCSQIVFKWTCHLKRNFSQYEVVVLQIARLFLTWYMVQVALHMGMVEMGKRSIGLANSFQRNRNHPFLFHSQQLIIFLAYRIYFVLD